MQALLRCPHGQETGWENQQGLRVYRHIADGSTCGLLNGLLVTPEELMLERCRSFLQHRRFIEAAELVEYAERLQVAGSRRQRQEIHEFLLCFHASLKARELVYKTLQEFVLTLMACRSFGSFLSWWRWHLVIRVARSRRGNIKVRSRSCCSLAVRR